MSKIRETLVTNCEKKFLNRCLVDWNRLDGRSFDEFRQLKIEFGRDWGACFVSLGKTRVLAQTSCEIQQPKSSRPSEGILNLNIELNPLAAPHFEPGRQTDLSVQLNRLLEKCVKDSKAVDLESLCIKTNEKVWALRVDVNVLNHEGNVLDCASIATLTSLAHFRRPDVTCDGEEFIIHSFQQRDPIRTVIHHYPVCITYSLFNGGQVIVADPNLTEEGSADASLVIGLNSFKELCGLHLGGKVELSPHVILNTVVKAISRVSTVINEIKEAVRIDTELRNKKVSLGFHLEKKPTTKSSIPQSAIPNLWKDTKKKTKREKRTLAKEPAKTVELIDSASAEHVPTDENITEWIHDDSDDDLVIIEAPKEQIDLRDTDSEEDDVIILDMKMST